MPAYIPKVICAKCQKEVPYGMRSVMRVHDETQRYIRVRCHGEEIDIPFETEPNQVVVLWRGGGDDMSE